MEDWQRHLIRQIADQIDAHLTGQQSVGRTLTNARGVFDAADLKGRADRDAFERLWFQVSLEDEAREPEFPTGTFSAERLDAALLALRSWAIQTGAGDGVAN
jgi:hypothetical protein